jgi:galactonate dehydratase
MKIEAVESLLIGGAHFVRIRTDDGRVGLGQSAAWGYPEASDAVARCFVPYLVGTDAMRVEHHWHALWRMAPFRGSVVSGAVSAVDIALWDLKGQRLGVPIWELLGGRVRERIRLHLLMGGGTPERIAANAGAAVAEGFTALKFDPLPDGYQDMALARLSATVREAVSAARETVGPDVDLIVELHRKLTPLQARAVGDALAGLAPLFVEDPIQIDSIASQSELARQLPVALANGERMHSIWEFREMLVAGGCQFVRPDLGLAGGISGCRKIAAIAESFHAAVVSHNFLGPVLTAAAVHLDASIPNFVVQEYTTKDESETVASVFDGVPARQGGYLPVPEAPGLGIRLREGLDVAAAPRLAPGERASSGTTLTRADGSVARAV